MAPYIPAIAISNRNTPLAIAPPMIGQLVSSWLNLEYTGRIIRIKPTT